MKDSQVHLGLIFLEFDKIVCFFFESLQSAPPLGFANLQSSDGEQIAGI